MGDESNGEDDIEKISYRGEIDVDDWEEFKWHVPRQIKLHEKINELIREYNAEQSNADRPPSKRGSETNGS